MAKKGLKIMVLVKIMILHQISIFNSMILEKYLIGSLVEETHLLKCLETHFLVVVVLDACLVSAQDHPYLMMMIFLPVHLVILVRQDYRRHHHIHSRHHRHLEVKVDS